MEFLNFSTPNFENLILKLLFLSFSGAVIRQALVMTGQRWANTFHHLGSYILLPNIALIITSHKKRYCVIIRDDWSSIDCRFRNQ